MGHVADWQQTEHAPTTEAEAYRAALRQAGVRPPTRTLRRDRVVVEPRPRLLVWLTRLRNIFR